MMNKPLGILVLLLPAVALGGGCGGHISSSRAGQTPAFGPHDGVLVALPDDSGYIEVVIEPVPGGRGRALRGFAVVAYFLGPDRQRPLEPRPSEVRIELDTPDRDRLDLRLTHQPKKADPSGAARFASAPGPYDFDETFGQLTATIQDQTISQPFASR